MTSERTRALLIELADELFAEHGYLQTSMRDLARKGEMTTGAVYGHFRNKADLLAAAIERRTADELEEPSTAVSGTPDYVETLTRLSRDHAGRRRLRALLVQGAAASLTDASTRARLRDEQRAHIDAWIAGYEANRDGQGIDASVDLPSAVLYSWAAELGLGVLEAIGVAAPPADGWADAANRFARGLKLPPATERSPAAGGPRAPRPGRRPAGRRATR